MPNTCSVSADNPNKHPSAAAAAAAAEAVPSQTTCTAAATTAITTPVTDTDSAKAEKQQSRAPPRNLNNHSSETNATIPTHLSTVNWDIPVSDTDFLYRKQLWKLRQRKSGITRLSIFDFDNTLFKSPLPNPRLWDKSLIGMLKSTDLGWFHDSRTLKKPFLHYTRHHWIKSTVSQVRQEAERSDDTLVVLLTGRSHAAYRSLIVNLVSHRPELLFDLIILKETPTRQSPLIPQDDFEPASSEVSRRTAAPLTFDYKMAVVEDTISAFPETKEIRMWDDRTNHCRKMQAYLDSMKARAESSIESVEVFYVPPQTICMEESMERKLVRSMINTHNERVYERALVSGLKPGDKDFLVGSLETNTYLAHIGVLLTAQSSRALQSEVRTPFGWTTEADRMVLIDGPDSQTVLEQDIGAKIGDKVTVVVDCIATFAGAFIAVRVTEIIDVEGRIIQPKLDAGSAAHIIVSYNGVDGARIASNATIGKWRPLISGRLKLEGLIAKHHLTSASIVMPKPVINEVSIGRLVTHYWPMLKGKEIGEKVAEIKQRMDEHGIDNIASNRDKIENIIKSHAFQTQENELPP
ncbi:hypothetical protein GGI25_005451 [Coemansia spiralis]|uniref:Swiss Army Knife RNA repair protein HAD domain-containing protein n=2 Tax=Coemansia TaxID=4863 RepID=A0A9W8FYL7_9FUNG|nr:hypothetical protein BX070DRAFT_251319 [Coemansia spiralis]KAJ1988217.1 hypothetical protein EDC05_005417 [Coemansia umbellata]KAJ2619634.1 hypothetical protein GGI26_005688 [Coemansia sp. RSA 1358]KAJ2671584.1 hypothetical protein GGI25_005451 [Coemansia spiralis]